MYFWWSDWLVKHVILLSIHRGNLQTKTKLLTNTRKESTRTVSFLALHHNVDEKITFEKECLLAFVNFFFFNIKITVLFFSLAFNIIKFIRLPVYNIAIIEQFSPLFVFLKLANWLNSSFNRKERLLEFCFMNVQHEKKTRFAI